MDWATTVCPFCGEEKARRRPIPGTTSYQVSCPKCGEHESVPHAAFLRAEKWGPQGARNMVDKAKPYVAVACVCEKVLTEADRVVSVIRIVDTFLLDIPDQVPPGVGKAVTLTAFVSLKAGEAKGPAEIGLKLRPPNGEPQPIQKWPVVLGEPYEGVNLALNFVLAEPVMGLYWFDVLWGEEVLTSIPFRLLPGEKKPTTQMVPSKP